jgi:NADH:ubiquinone oxidoreductase subunit 3 (subunit A)
VKSIKHILSGIGFIVFGIACLLMLSLHVDWILIWIFGFLTPFVGFIMVIIGIYSKESPSEEKKSES